MPYGQRAGGSRCATAYRGTSRDAQAGACLRQLRGGGRERPTNPRPRACTKHCRSACPKALQTAFETTQVATTDLYRSPSGRVHLDLVAPLVKEDRWQAASGGRRDPRHPGRTGRLPVDPELADAEPERRDAAGAPGGGQRVVSERIAPSQGNGAGIQSSPDDPELPAARAVLAGTAQVMEGKDYRGSASWRRRAR
jgi:hypothetical protein